MVRFDTYGPFALVEYTPAGIRFMFEDIAAVDADLPDAAGIYVFWQETESGRLVPMYVGKADNKFGERIRHHLDNKQHWLLLGPQKIGLFLIALLSSTGSIATFTDRVPPGSGAEALHDLEFSLIRTCVLQNPNLDNIHRNTSKDFGSEIYVPGYSPNSPDVLTASALAFAKMLNIRSN